MSDDFDFDGTRSQSRGSTMQLWDMLSILVLIITVCLAGYFIWIFLNPQSSFNFLPPASSRIPTLTPTPMRLEPTWTASPTLELTSSNTPRPTFTPFFTNTPFSRVPPTRTLKPPTATATPKAPFSATTQQVESTVIHPELACNWALLGHPNVEIGQVTSRSHLGEYVYQVHPNLRKRTQLKFSDAAALEPVDILFLAQPHGQAQHHIEEYAKLAPKIIDLAADFRLRDAAFYEQWYGEKHAVPEWLSRFVYGLPELHRLELASASYVSGVGCNATASNLALLPLIKADLLDLSSRIVIEIKVGSSEGGAEGNSRLTARRTRQCDPDVFRFRSPPHIVWIIRSGQGQRQ